MRRVVHGRPGCPQSSTSRPGSRIRSTCARAGTAPTVGTCATWARRATRDAAASRDRPRRRRQGPRRRRERACAWRADASTVPARRAISARAKPGEIAIDERTDERDARKKRRRMRTLREVILTCSSVAVTQVRRPGAAARALRRWSAMFGRRSRELGAQSQRPTKKFHRSWRL